MGKKRTRSKGKRTAYTKGSINKLIDGLVHPLCASDRRFIVLDVLLHALNERNSAQTARKFVRYSLPEILKEASKKQ